MDNLSSRQDSARKALMEELRQRFPSIASGKRPSSSNWKKKEKKAKLNHGGARNATFVRPVWLVKKNQKMVPQNMKTRAIMKKHLHQAVEFQKNWEEEEVREEIRNRFKLASDDFNIMVTQNKSIVPINLVEGETLTGVKLNFASLKQTIIIRADFVDEDDSMPIHEGSPPLPLHSEMSLKQQTPQRLVHVTLNREGNVSEIRPLARTVVRETCTGPPELPTASIIHSDLQSMELPARRSIRMPSLPEERGLQTPVIESCVPQWDELPVGREEDVREWIGYEQAIRNSLQPVTSCNLQSTENSTPSWGIDIDDEPLLNEIPIEGGTSDQIIRLELHRGQVFEELLNAFHKTSLSNDEINIRVTMLDEIGRRERAADSGGVFRDAVSEFWQQFYARCTVGHNSVEKVPIIRDDFGEEKWKIVAHILLKGYKQSGYFPISLSRPFMENCLFGKEISDDLTESFLLHVGEYEKCHLEKARHDWETADHEEIVNILSSYNCVRIPTKHTFESILRDLAHKELIQRSQFVIDSWKGVLMGVFQTSDLEKLYQEGVPNATNFLRLVKHIDCGQLTCDESKVFNFLRSFVRGAAVEHLAALCRFATGSDVITCEKLNVSFNAEGGLKRGFVGHTCSNELEISKTYDNFQDFRSELLGILSSNIWEMQLI